MAKGSKKRFNKSGRDQSLRTTVASNVKILEGNLESADFATENDPNALVLEHKQIITKRAVPVKQKLSRKRRKQLERLLDQKEKKLKRGREIMAVKLYYYSSRLKRQ